MEEKERFELFGEHCIKDNNPDARPQLFDACVACVILNEQYKHIKDLEAKLAEKDKEISNLNGLVRERDKQIKNLKTNKKRVIEHKNKNKISFTIEKLEKVKENAWQSATDISCLLDYTELAKIIDNQIKSLKGEE